MELCVRDHGTPGTACNGAYSTLEARELAHVQPRSTGTGFGRPGGASEHCKSCSQWVWGECNCNSLGVADDDFRPRPDDGAAHGDASGSVLDSVNRPHSPSCIRHSHASANAKHDCKCAEHFNNNGILHAVGVRHSDPLWQPDALANVDNFGCLNGDRHADRLRNGNGLCHGHDDELPNPLWIWHRARDAHALGQSHRVRKPLFDRHANRLHLSDPDQLAEQYSHVLGNRFAFGHCHSIALAGSLRIHVAKRFPVLERVRNQHSNEQHVALHDWNSLFERLAFGHRDGFAKRLRNHELDADDVDDCLVDAIQLGVSLVHVDPDTVQLRVKHPHPQQLADADRDSAGNASRDDDRNVNCNAHPNWNSLGDHDPAAVQHRDSRPNSVVVLDGDAAKPLRCCRFCVSRSAVRFAAVPVRKPGVQRDTHPCRARLLCRRVLHCASDDVPGPLRDSNRLPLRLPGRVALVLRAAVCRIPVVLLAREQLLVLHSVRGWRAAG